MKVRSRVAEVYPPRPVDLEPSLASDFSQHEYSAVRTLSHSPPTGLDAIKDISCVGVGHRWFLDHLPLWVKLAQDRRPVPQEDRPRGPRADEQHRFCCPVLWNGRLDGFNVHIRRRPYLHQTLAWGESDVEVTGLIIQDNFSSLVVTGVFRKFKLG